MPEKQLGRRVLNSCVGLIGQDLGWPARPWLLLLLGLIKKQQQQCRSGAMNSAAGTDITEEKLLKEESIDLVTD